MKRFNLINDIDILSFDCSVMKLPCNPNGGSPFLLIDHSRVTDPIFTGPYCTTYRYCGMASEKPMSDRWCVRRRVDWFSSEKFYEGIVLHTTVNLLLFYVSRLFILSLFFYLEHCRITSSKPSSTNL